MLRGRARLPRDWPASDGRHYRRWHDTGKGIDKALVATQSGRSARASAKPGRNSMAFATCLTLDLRNVNRASRG